MRYIKKSEIEPRDLREYKKNCRKASPPLKITYKDMPKDGTRQQLARDQGYLCAYCMRRISLGVLRKMQKRLAMPTVESWKKISRQCA